MFESIFKFFEWFTKLPKSTQGKIIEALISSLSFAFRRLFFSKKTETLKTATDLAVTPQQWQSTTEIVNSYVPSIYPSKKKQEFANSLVNLIKSNNFITELSNRIEGIQAIDEETYVALCSIETKKLIIEMMDKKK